MNADREEHWNRAYAEKDPSSVSWFQSEPGPSLRALDRFGAKPRASLVDVGGGASNLVDTLLVRGWRDVTVLDIAPSALDRAKGRLGEGADNVEWEVADVTTWHPLADTTCGTTARSSTSSCSQNSEQPSAKP